MPAKSSAESARESRGSVLLPEVHVYTASGARPNPGPADIAVLLQDPFGTEIDSVGAQIGHRTNNQAEYQAVIRGLDLATKYTNGKVSVFSSNDPVVGQLAGRYRIKSNELKSLHEAVRVLEKRFQSVSYQYSPAGKREGR